MLLRAPLSATIDYIILVTTVITYNHINIIIFMLADYTVILPYAADLLL